MNLKCSNCGKIIETISLRCGYSISVNQVTNIWECDLGQCGIRSLDELLCANCCQNLA